MVHDHDGAPFHPHHILARTAALFGERLGWRVQVFGEGDCRHAVIDGGSARLLVTAIGEPPSPSVRAAARVALARQSLPTAVVVLYPAVETGWAHGPLAYVAHRPAREIITNEAPAARLALSDVRGLALLSERGTGLLVGPGGMCFARETYSDPDERRAAFLAGAAAWQSLVVASSAVEAA